jgi:drug/metabolite transporter (DMT)-like permease
LGQPSPAASLLMNRSILGSNSFSYRFFGIFGIYYSLQFLSLSDATVLTFLIPMCTAMAGALFLGENFSRREAFAGRK